MCTGLYVLFVHFCTVMVTDSALQYLYFDCSSIAKIVKIYTINKGKGEFD